jgi:murein DD-endopeptidase MepM/ murein hydrolase activator NlpD
MKMTVCRIILLFLSLSSILYQRALSAEYRISGVRGYVSLLREGEGNRPVEKNDVLVSGDTLRTKRDSFLSFRTEDVFYRVYPYSTVKIGSEPVLIWGKLGKSDDGRFLDIRFFFFPKPAQGRTMEVVVRSTSSEIAISSAIEGGSHYTNKLVFYPVGDGEYRAITGFDVETSSVKYGLRINARKDDEYTTIVYPFYLRTVRYGTGTVTIGSEKSGLFAPSDRKNKEWNVLREVLSTPSSKAMWNGVFEYPVADPVIISQFGKKRVYLVGERDGFARYHRGIDFRGNRGDEVLAPQNGRVVFTGERVSTGNTLVIDHGQGVYSLFYHLDSIQVGEGDSVEMGAKVAEIGSTGIAAGTHLHWSIYVNGVWVNPNDWIEIKF